MIRASLTLVATMGFLLAACGGGEPASLKPVQQQQVGEIMVSILSETGTMKQGASSFNLEFRKISDNQLVDVGTVDVAPVMEMPGMGPMMAPADVRPSGTAGRYNVTSNISMGGLWKFRVTFGNGQSAQFNLNAG